MKKLSIFFTAALALGFAACSDDDNTGMMQENPQLPVMKLADLKAAPSADIAEAVQFAPYQETELEAIPVLDLSYSNLPEGYEIEGVMEFGPNADFSGCGTVALKTVGTTLYAPVYLWENAYLEVYSKNPRETQNYVRFLLKAVNGTSVYELAPANEEGTFSGHYYWCEHKVKITPLPATVIVEENYYMILNGEEILLTPNNPSDVYNPPYFSKDFVVEAGTPANIKVKSQSGVVYGMGSEEGTLEVGGPAIVVSEASPWLFLADMENMTYTISLAIPNMWATGSVFNEKNSLRLDTEDFVHYTGIYGVIGGDSRNLKLANAAVAKEATVFYGAKSADIPAALSGELKRYTTADECLPAKITGAACYWLTANLSTKEWSVEPVEYFGLIGEFNGWSNEQPDVIMSSDRKGLVWTAEITIEEGTIFKIRANSSWDNADPNFGGTMDDLIEHGGDIQWNQPSGTYKVTLDLSKRPYTLTAVKK